MQYMDKIDRKILALLDMDSRMQSSDMARKLKTSRQVVDYRISQLEKNGPLLGCTTLIDPFYFVNNVWHTYVKLQSLTDESEKKIIDFLGKQKKVWWFAKCQGEWDLIFSTAGDNVLVIEKTLREFREKFSEFINDEQTTTMISALNFSRGYFIEKDTPKKTYVKSSEKVSIDEKDVKILEILSLNSRLPATKIAEKINLSARQVIYRIKELKSKGVIRLFRTHLNLKRLNYDYYKVCFYANQYNKDMEGKLISWCEKNPYSIFFLKKLAPWSFEIEFETPDYKVMNKTLSGLKNLFGSRIKRAETTVIIEEFKGELDIIKSI